MAARIDRIIRLGDLPLFINEVADPSSVPSRGVATCAIGKTEGSLSIAEQAERKIIFTGKSRVLGNGVEANAKNFDIARTKLVDLVAEPTTFRRSARRIGFGVEP